MTNEAGRDEARRATAGSRKTREERDTTAPGHQAQDETRLATIIEAEQESKDSEQEALTHTDTDRPPSSA